MDLINTFHEKRLFDKFYDEENKNVQVLEKNNSSDNERYWEVSDFLSSEDSCWWVVTLPVQNFYSKQLY